MAFYKEKGWWKSKTVWTGIVSAVLGILSLFGLVPPGLTAETVLGGIMAVVGVATIFFRGQADSAVVLTEK